MVRIHQDTFKFGDIVTWRDEDKATITGGRRRYGDRVTICQTKQANGSTRQAAHTQYVTIMEDPRSDGWFSGAFFRHLAEWEKETDHG